VAFIEALLYVECDKCHSLWSDTDNEPLERGMWFDTGLDGKRFQEVCPDCLLFISQQP
jgi:hypothetical protein